MPEELAPPPTVDLPPDATTDQVFAAFAASDPQRFPQHAEKQAFPQPVAKEAKPEPAPAKEPEPVKEEKSGLEIPDQFLGKKEEAATDEWDALSKEEPKGQLKHEDYKKLKSLSQQKIDKLKADLSEREAKLAEAAKRGDSEATLARLKAAEEALAEREAILEREAVQHSKQFKERFTTKETAISERLKRTATEMGLDNETLQQALASSLKRRTELLDNVDMPVSVRGAVDSLMVQYDLLQDDKGAFLEQSKEEAARWREEQQKSIAHQEQKRTEYENKIFNEALDELSKTFAPFQEVEGNPQWNAQAKEMRAEVMRYLNGQVDLKPLCIAAAKGVASPVLEKINARQHEIIQDQAKQIAAFKAAQPGANGHIPTPDGKEDDSHLSAEQRAKNTFNRIVGSAQNRGF